MMSRSLPEHDDSLEKITRLERENAAMRENINRLMAEIAEIKGARNSQPTATINAEILEVPMAEGSDGSRPPKKRAIACDQENVSRKAKSEVREMLTALSESLKQLGDRITEMQSKMTTLEANTNQRLAKMESFLEFVVGPVTPPNPPIRLSEPTASNVAPILAPPRVGVQLVRDGSAP